MNDFEFVVHEVVQLLQYLEFSVQHADNLVGTATNFWVDSNDNERPVSTLNYEAVKELEAVCKKISSKSDTLQNKVQQLSKLMPE